MTIGPVSASGPQAAPVMTLVTFLMGEDVEE